MIERRANPKDDLISQIVQSEIDGEKLSDSEAVGFIVLLLVAGNETTTNLMSNMLAILADRPELWARLRADRSLVERMIEETLRYESPVQLLLRQTTRDVEIDGTLIPAQSRVGIYFGAANRDPEEFPNPDEFQIDRDFDQHLAFGYGIHFCLGSQLARTEARITLTGCWTGSRPLRRARGRPNGSAGHRLCLAGTSCHWRLLALLRARERTRSLALAAAAAELHAHAPMNAPKESSALAARCKSRAR